MKDLRLCPFLAARLGIWKIFKIAHFLFSLLLTTRLIIIIIITNFCCCFVAFLWTILKLSNVQADSEEGHDHMSGYQHISLSLQFQICFPFFCCLFILDKYSFKYFLEINFIIQNPCEKPGHIIGFLEWAVSNLTSL